MQLDLSNLDALVRLHDQRQGMPPTIYDGSANVSATAYLESLSTITAVDCPAEIVTRVRSIAGRASVAKVAAVLLADLRRCGKAPQPVGALAPVAINVSDRFAAVEALALAYRAERPAPREITVGGRRMGTLEFLDALQHDRAECPGSAATNIGVAAHPATMAEAGVTLAARLRHSGAIQ